MITEVKEKEKVTTVVSINNASNAVEEKDVLRNVDVWSLFNGMRDFLSSSSDIPGNVAYAFSRSIDKLESKLKSIDKHRYENIIKKYVVLDEKGVPAITTVSEEDMKKGIQPDYVYPNDEARESAKKNMEAIMAEPADIELYKVKKEYWDNVVIRQNPRPVRFLDMIIKYVVE